jgi:Co/Zn/Cd efflux system component
MNKTTFHIPKMDCVAEEQLIRMKLNGEPEVFKLMFDLQGRKLEVYHQNDAAPIVRQLKELGLGSQLIDTTDEYFSEEVQQPDDTKAERKMLWIVFFINFGFFVVEIITGFIARSMGLVADSLDMLADAIVFAMSLFVVGKALRSKKKIAGIAGYLQLALAFYGIFEVVNRFYGYDKTPNYGLMIIISTIALAGNSVTLYLLQKAKNKEAHIQAGSIFISNDVMINIGVILGGVLVYFTHSKIPDLVIGGIVFLIVGKGAFRIMKLAK